MLVTTNTSRVAAAEEAAKASAKALDAILDQAIQEFEEEEGLVCIDDAETATSSQKLSGDKGPLRVDRSLEGEMRTAAMANLDQLVENLRNPAFESTLTSTLQALSGSGAGATTIAELLRIKTPRPPGELELDRGVATTMEALATEAHDMEGLETAQLAATGEELVSGIIAEFDKLGQKEDFDQVVDNMMRQLLARDLMYEPMKLVCEKYPEWLAEHVDGLTADEYQQYGTQYQYFQRIVAVYEREPENFPRLMELLQDLQNYGQPPAEIVKELAPGLEFTPDGMPLMNATENAFPPPGALPAMPAELPMPDVAAAKCTVS